MNQQPTRSASQPWIRPLLWGLCVGVLCCTLLLLLAALLIRSVEIPHAAVTPIALAVASVSALVAGWITAITAGRRGLLMGLICGGLLALLLLLAGLTRTGDFDTGYTALRTALLTVAGAIGGILGVNRKRR